MTTCLSATRVKALLAPIMLLCLSLGAQAAPEQPTGSPRRLINHLGVSIREILETPGSEATPADAERAVAAQITALIARSPGHLLLTETDKQGRTPLMLAASGGYPQVVKALLSDPSVRLTVNQADKDGETAWMLANFAPTATLFACEPGTLTVERYALLPPYLRRLATVLKPDLGTLAAIVGDLEAAGAEIKPGEAKAAWLARCPNAAPELRKALDSGELLPTLLRDSLDRITQFNKVAKESPDTLPKLPPDGMKFVHDSDDGKPTADSWPLLGIGGMVCSTMPKPVLPGKVYWSGNILFKVAAVTRAGVVEGADFSVIEGPKDRKLAAGFRNIILQALAKYRCDGDVAFVQEFLFDIH